MKNWKTTAAGILSAIVLIAPQLLALIDNNPSTHFDLSVVLAALSVLGIGWSAKDK